MAYEVLGLVRNLTLAVVQPSAEVPTGCARYGAVYDYCEALIPIQVLDSTTYVRSEVAHVTTSISRCRR